MLNGAVAIIPARSKSKGLPNKNLRELCGKPLLTYTIEAAFESKVFERVVVSTENEKIASVAKEYKAIVIDRPKELAEDDSIVVDAVKHAIDSLQKDGFEVDFFVLLQPTSPLRGPYDIRNAVKLFLENGKKNVVSVSKPRKNHYYGVKVERGIIKPLFGWRYLVNKRRQDLPETFEVNGAIYIATPESLLKHNNFFGSKTIAFIMPPERSIDIDDEKDLVIAEALLKMS